MTIKRRRTWRLGTSRTLDEGAASFYPSNIQLPTRLFHAHDPRTDQRSPGDSVGGPPPLHANPNPDNASTNTVNNATNPLRLFRRIMLLVRIANLVGSPDQPARQTHIHYLSLCYPKNQDHFDATRPSPLSSWKGLR